MKKHFPILSFVLFSFLILSVLTFHTVQAEECIPQGPISISGPNGQTLEGDISPMGAITIDYPGYGTLQGFVSPLGHFSASNDITTISGDVDISCPSDQSSQSLPLVGSQCVVPVAVGCTDQNQVGGMTIRQNMYGMGGSSIGQGAIQACQDQVNQYNAQTAAFNSCISGMVHSAPATPKIVDYTSGTTIGCQNQHGPHSVTDGGSCSCTSSYYQRNDGQCVVLPPKPTVTTSSVTQNTPAITPVITVLGDSTIIINQGDKYVDPGATATDQIDGDLTSKIKVTNPVNTNKPGTYAIYYWVMDSARNSAIETRVVIVSKTLSQTISSTIQNKIISSIKLPFLQPTSGTIVTQSQSVAEPQTPALVQSAIPTKSLVQQISDFFGKLKFW